MWHAQRSTWSDVEIFCSMCCPASPSHSNAWTPCLVMWTFIGHLLFTYRNNQIEPEGVAPIGGSIHGCRPWRQGRPPCTVCRYLPQPAGSSAIIFSNCGADIVGPAG